MSSDTGFSIDSATNRHSFGKRQQKIPLLTHIAIVGAMENEIRFLRKSITPACRTKDRYAVGMIGSKAIMLLRTGVGPQKAIRRLTETRWAHPPDCVLSIGCGGALSPNLDVGDAVIPERIVTTIQGGKTLSPSAELTEIARECCKDLNVRFHSKTTVSTAEVVARPEDKMALAAKYDAIAVDMESAQIAEWAGNLGVPMLSIRTISDTLEDCIPPETATIVGPTGKIILRNMFFLFLSRPKLFLEIVRLKKNLDLSLKVLEKIVLAFIQQI